MTRVLIAFGSPSDHEKYFKPDFAHAPDTRYWLSVNSAHRVPDVVEEHARAMPYDAIIAGAGMKNALMDAYFRRCPDAIHVALPISDSRTGGLSSVLSSSEMPPGCPVAMSRMDDMGAAVDFVNYATGRQFDSVRLHQDSDEDSRKVFLEAARMFDEMEVCVNHTHMPNAINVVAYSGPYIFDKFSRDDRAVASFAMPLRSEIVLHNYLSNLRDVTNVVHTGVADGTNLALYVAKIIARNDPAVKKKLAKRFAAGQKKYEPFRDLREV